MKKRIFLFLLALLLCLVGCEKATGEETLPSGEETLPSGGETLPSDVETVPIRPGPIISTRETTAPVYTILPMDVAQTIAWREPDNSWLYSFENYYRFERIFSGVVEELRESVSAEEGMYTPCFENGQLCLCKDEIIFPISEEKFTELNIFGTDGTKWIYCASSGTELFRMDPLGNKEVLFQDDSGRISTLRLEDYGNIGFFTAGAEKGYGVYRIHLPSKKVELLAQEQEPITLGWPDSNFRIKYYLGNPEAGGEDRTTPGQEWDLSDPNVQLFQKLLEPSEEAVLNGYNNWYNAATFLLFDRPEAISLPGLMRNGFRDLPTKLTEKELAALGSEASGDKDYFKLPGDRVEAVLKMISGLRIKDLDKNSLIGGASMLAEPILYLEQTDTYYVPCPMEQWEDPPAIYISKQPIKVHLVEELEDGTYRVFYMGYTPAPFWSSTDLEEKVMVLKQSGDGWHILSNGPAVLPMPS